MFSTSYWVLINSFSFDTHADHFSECVESHAFETYDKFIKSQGGKT